MKTLRDIPVGTKVKVAKVLGSGAVRKRIMDMGITNGIELLVRSSAPLGDPIELLVRGYSLLLRRADAELIEIE